MVGRTPWPAGCILKSDIFQTLFQAEILDAGYIGLMKDEMRMWISLFMSYGGVIMANYFVEDAYL